MKGKLSCVSWVCEIYTKQRFSCNILNSSLELQHSCIPVASMQRDLRLKVKHPPQDLPLEGQHLETFHFRDVSQLFYFVVLRSNSLLANLILCLQRFEKQKHPMYWILISQLKILISQLKKLVYLLDETKLSVRFVLPGQVMCGEAKPSLTFFTWIK